MTLDDFLATAKDDNGKPLSDAAFGERCGMSQSQISRLRNGKSKPSFETIEAIRAATGGAVSPNDWFVEAAE
jgi:transcriptional regulator with XRE-family HTH domain